jgi:hypothetical protein
MLVTFEDKGFGLVAKCTDSECSDFSLGESHMNPLQWSCIQEQDIHDCWESHSVASLPRRCDSLAVQFSVHRLAVSKATAARLNEALAAVVEEKQAGIQSSNIGGFHSARTLFDRPDMRAAKLSEVCTAAMAKVEAYEANLSDCLLPELSRPVAITCTEGWLNVSSKQDWNHMHNHAGFTYSGVYFVDDGGALDGTDRFGGRLFLLPEAPNEISTEDQMHMHRRIDQDLEEHGIRYLMIDPTPGTIIIFPSYVPHFVLPCDRQPIIGDGAGDNAGDGVGNSAGAGAGAGAGDGTDLAHGNFRDTAAGTNPPRISVAFNASFLGSNKEEGTDDAAAAAAAEAAEAAAAEAELPSPLQAFLSGGNR